MGTAARAHTHVHGLVPRRHPPTPTSLGCSHVRQGRGGGGLSPRTGPRGRVPGPRERGSVCRRARARHGNEGALCERGPAGKRGARGSGDGHGATADPSPCELLWRGHKVGLRGLGTSWGQGSVGGDRGARRGLEGVLGTWRRKGHVVASRVAGGSGSLGCWPGTLQWRGQAWAAGS